MNYDCKKCKHDGDQDYCDDCSVIRFIDNSCSCSCHSNPPCGYCEGMKFEEKDDVCNNEN